MKRDLAFSALSVDTGLPVAWRRALPPLAFAVAVIVACYVATARQIVHTWAGTETYAHGFVVVPIVAWLLYRMRDRLRACSPQPSWIVLPLFAIAGFAWLLGRFGTVNALSQTAFVAMLVLAAPAVLGLRTAREMMFPLGFLFFAVPLGDFLLPFLMERTADFTIVALRASGVPVYREGLNFVIPSGRWSVIEACSGVRYLIASLMTGTLFAYVTYRSNWRRFAFIAVAIVVPIVANWIRAYMIVMLAHLTNNELATGVDHVLYGWLFFGIVMLLMFWIGASWREEHRFGTAAADRTLQTLPSPRTAAPATLWLAVAAIAVVTVPWPAFESMSERQNASDVTLPALDVPAWTPDASAPPFVPEFHAPSASVQRVMRSGADTVAVYIAYYRNQGAYRKVASSQNVLVPSLGSPWMQVAATRRDVDLGGTKHRVVASELRNARGGGVVAWQWYWIDGAITSSNAMAKARTAWERLTGRGDDGAAIVVYAPMGSGGEQALARFVHDAWPGIATMLEAARSSR
jgi:exosortase A